jgi:hypothetical protein
MLDTKIFLSKNNQSSIIDNFRDSEKFLRKMVSLILQDRMHLWSTRYTIFDDNDKKRGFDIIYDNSITDTNE